MEFEIVKDNVRHLQYTWMRVHLRPFLEIKKMFVCLTQERNSMYKNGGKNVYNDISSKPGMQLRKCYMHKLK